MHSNHQRGAFKLPLDLHRDLNEPVGLMGEKAEKALSSLQHELTCVALCLSLLHVSIPRETLFNNTNWCSENR